MAQGCEYSDLTVTPGHLEFTAKEGSRYVCTNQRLSIKKAAGGGTLPPDWSIHLEGVSPCDWLKARPMSGREAKKVIVSGDPRKMPAGEIICLLHFTSTVEAVTITPSVIPVKMTVRPPKPPPPEPFVCSECGEVFETEDELGLHTEQEHEPPPEPFICSHCGAEFSTEGELQHHIEQEHPEPPEEPPPEEPEYNWLEKVIKWILDFFRGRK